MLTTTASSLPIVGNVLAFVIEPASLAIPLVAKTLKLPYPLFFAVGTAALALDAKIGIDGAHIACAVLSRTCCRSRTDIVR